MYSKTIKISFYQWNLLNKAFNLTKQNITTVEETGLKVNTDSSVCEWGCSFDVHDYIDSCRIKVVLIRENQWDELSLWTVVEWLNPDKKVVYEDHYKGTILKDYSFDNFKVNLKII